MADKCRPIDVARRMAELTWSEAVSDPSRLGFDADMASVERARDVLRPCLSLEEISDELDIVDDEESPVDVVVDRAADATTWADLSEHLELLPGLGNRSVAILEMRFGITGQEPMTLDQIGQHFGVTRERIRQIEKKSLEALRELA